MYLNLALCTPTWAPCTAHEANLGHVGTILGPMLAHVGLTFGSSVACLLVLRFSAFWAVNLDSCLLLLCLLCFPVYKGAQAKNTVKYHVFSSFCSVRLQGQAARSMLKAKRTELQKQAYSSINTTGVQHFWDTFWPLGAEQEEMALKVRNLAPTCANLGPT